MFDVEKWWKTMTKVEYREITRNIAYLRRIAEEFVDELCCFEADVLQMFQNRGKRPRKDEAIVFEIPKTTIDILKGNGKGDDTA